MSWKLEITRTTTATPPSYAVVVESFFALPVAISQLWCGPFGIYLANDNVETDEMDCGSIAKNLMLQGCRSVWVSGRNASMWEDAFDVAVVDLYRAAKAGVRVLPHDIYEAKGRAGAVTTSSGTWDELVHFFTNDELLSRNGPLVPGCLLRTSAGTTIPCYSLSADECRPEVNKTPGTFHCGTAPLLIRTKRSTRS